MRVKVPKGAEVKTGVRVKNTAFFPKGTADRIRYDKGRDEIVREWKWGKKTKRTREPVDQRPTKNLKRLQSAGSINKRTKKGTRRLMIRRAGAINPSGAMVYTPEIAQRYLKELGGQIYREQVQRYRNKGFSLNEARQKAKAAKDDVIESLYTVEVEEE